MTVDLSPWVRVLRDTEIRERYLSYVAEWEEKIHSFLEFDIDKGVGLSTGPGPEKGGGPQTVPAGGTEKDDTFAGVPFAVKDNIAVQGFRFTCGSKMLENLIAPYTATCVQKLLDAGAVVFGKTNLDEFGMGSSTDNSALLRTNNPWDVSRVAGGSSGGSAAAVAAGLVPFALGTDTGGSVRQPAAFCGVYGLKPTYGSVSRYGLTAYASSLEVPGVISKSIPLMEAVFKVVRGTDPLDHSTVDGETAGSTVSSESEESVGRGDVAPRRPVRTIGILSSPLSLDPDIECGYLLCIDTLKKLGYDIREVKLPTLEYVVPAYYTIATAEASANLARFNGIRYGARPEECSGYEELVKKARDQGFGDEVKLRILLGTYVLRSGFQDQYYLRAQKIRTAIRNDFEKIFTEADVLLTPAFPTSAFRHGSAGMDQFRQKLADKFTGTANLAGIPALSFPVGVEEGIPIGMQLLAPFFAEERLFEVASRYADVYPVPDCPGCSEKWS